MCESSTMPGYVHYDMFKKVIIGWKSQSSKLLDDETVLEAFVACGGQPNGEGVVDSSKLIEIIKEQFEMTINIEKLLAEIDTN